MIITELYNGQGLGNQLWCYVVTRCIAKSNGFNFGIQSPQKYKGKEFLPIDMGLEVLGGEGPEGGPPNVLPKEIFFYYKEKGNVHPKTKIFIGKKDDSLFEIEDCTKIDGVMQSIHYIENFKSDIKNWLKPSETHNIKSWSSDDVCAVHVRGGDFLGSSAFLHTDYYTRCMKRMLEKNSNMKFVVVTDDVLYAKHVCPGIEIVGGSSTGVQDSLKASHHIGGPLWMDWTILYNAKNIILSASSFSFWPAWLNDEADVLAPMYWGDYKCSDGYWSCGDSLIPKWNYLNRNGRFYSYEEALNLKNDYEIKNKNLWE